MKQLSYNLPKFCGVIYRKVLNNLAVYDIDEKRFLQYCLAVKLFTLKQFRDLLPGIPFSKADDDNLMRLCSLGFSEGDHQQDDDPILIGLCEANLGDELIEDIEGLINSFCRYDVLKDIHEEISGGTSAYDRACTNLEILRNKFRLPGRFRYNKFIRRDNPHFKGGIVVEIPDDSGVSFDAAVSVPSSNSLPPIE